MKSAMLVIVSALVVATNADDANSIFGRHRGSQDENQGGKLRGGAVMRQRTPKDIIGRHSLNARRLWESMSMSAPIFEAEMSMGSMPLLDSEPVRRRLTESVSMSTPIFEAEMSLSIPAAVAEPKGKARKLHARRLMESMSMSAPIFEAEMSLGSMPLFDSEITSLSMPTRRRLR